MKVQEKKRKVVVLCSTLEKSWHYHVVVVH